MGLASFWTSITGSRVREIAPAKDRNATLDRRPATSSGVRTARKTPSIDDDDDDGAELNRVESLLTKNIIEPPPATAATFEENKARRRSRGLSLSRSKTDDGVKRRRSLFGAKKDVEQSETVPDVPTLPTLSAIYSRQAPHHLNDTDRPSTAVSAIASPTSPGPFSPASTVAAWPTTAPRAPPIAAPEVFELPAEVPASTITTAAKISTEPAIEVKKSRRRSLGEALSGKRSKSMGAKELSSKGVNGDTPPIPALAKEQAADAVSKIHEEEERRTGTRSRRNSNASVASKASRASRKSRRKSWWQRGKKHDEDISALPPVPGVTHGHAKQSSTETPAGNVDVSAFPSAPAAKMAGAEDGDDTASIRTTRSEKSTARSKPQSPKTKKPRPVSSASQVRWRRRSWWASSNPDDSDDDSNPLPPIPLLVRSAGTTPDSSPTNSHTGHSPSHNNSNKPPRPVSGVSASGYRPRSAAKSFLVSTTPVSDNVRKSVRHSLHGGDEDLDVASGNDRGTYCLSAEQAKEWEKLKHLMAVMDRRRDVQRKKFGEESVADLFPAAPKGLAGGGGGGIVKAEEIEEERKGGVPFSNRSALAALEVGVAK